MDTTVGQVCQDSHKTERANTEYAAEWGAGEQHTVHKNSLLCFIGERDMGQNDPPRSDELSVTKRQRYVLSKNVVLVKKTHTTQTGYL